MWRYVIRHEVFLYGACSLSCTSSITAATLNLSLPLCIHPTPFPSYPQDTASHTQSPALLCLMYLPLPLTLLPCHLQGTRHRESDRMARYGSSDDEDDEEATAEVVRFNDIHEIL